MAAHYQGKMPQRTITALDLAEQEAYWLKILHRQLPILDEFFDYPRSLTQTFLRAQETIHLNGALWTALEQRCQQEGIQSYPLFLTALKILLALHTAQQSVIVGTISADSLRVTQGQQEQFVNPIALWTDVSDDPPVHTLLQRLVQTLREVAANRDYPFEQLVDRFVTQQDHNKAPLFQVMFLFLEEPWSLSTVPISQQDVAEVEDFITRCDLLLLIQKTDGTIQIQCDYDTALFDAATIQYFLGHFQRVLESLITEPEKKISELSLLSETEREQVLVTWNSTQTAYRHNAGLHHFFEHQAQLTPDRDAVVSGSDRMTYGELERRSRSLAHRLRKKGICPDMPIGLFVERSLEMTIGILAILRAGGAYVPFDPTLPSHRLTLLLEETNPLLIIAPPDLIPRLPQSSIEVIPISSADTELETQGELPDNVHAEHLACILYTSGSTGKPKGVMLSHHMLVNLLHWHQTTLISQARTLQFASPGFDQSIHEMFSAWASGGTLYVLPEACRTDIPAMATYLIDNQIEKIFVPVLVLQQLAAIYSTSVQLPLSLKEVLATGEQLRITQPLRNFFAQLTTCTLHNHYGPTESHVVTTYQLSSNTADWPSLPPIGRPIANTQIYLLNKHLQPVPVGVTGELYISGHCLARGYRGKPELTAESFLPNPYAGDSFASRMYRTGDLARHRSDGTIEFLGRRDHQIKIRGFRIEPGEIEATLANHPLVRTSIVQASQELAETPYLIAYVVSHAAEPSPTATELRHFLEMRLPSYMVPTTFILLETLPLNRNGKIDRSALPLPDKQTLARENVFAAPQTPLEKKLVQIWVALLRVQHIGIHDNFFALGGHSLLGAQLIATIRKEFQVELTHYEIFETPTISGLAKNIESIQLAAQIGQIVPTSKGENDDEFEL